MKVKLKSVRLAFSQNLHTAGTFNGEGKPKFSCTLLVPKSDAEQLVAVNDAIAAVAREKWGAKADAVLKGLIAGGKVCIRDGATKADYAGFEDAFFISTSSEVKPTILDRDGSPLGEASGKPYAGCYVHAIIDVWAQDNAFGKRINAQLSGVKFVKDGEPFAGGRPAAESDFDEFGDEDDDASDLL
jgi:hypothetical protein